MNTEYEINSKFGGGKYSKQVDNLCISNCEKYTNNLSKKTIDFMKKDGFTPNTEVYKATEAIYNTNLNKFTSLKDCFTNCIPHTQLLGEDTNFTNQGSNENIFGDQ